MENREAKAYDLLGGEEVLRRIVRRFYELMDTEEEFRLLRSAHPESLQNAEDRLFLFLSGWLGGPNLFMEKHGHPRLRARHMPFKIGKAERDQWVICMVQAFDDNGVQEPLRSELLLSLLKLADHMRNVSEPAEG